MCITPFCTFLSRRCTTTTWKCLISCFVEDGNTRQQLSFSFPEFWYSPLEFNSKTFSNIWRIERDGISAIKFEAARIHFLSYVFLTVAVVVAWLPIDFSSYSLKLRYFYYPLSMLLVILINNNCDYNVQKFYKQIMRLAVGWTPKRKVEKIETENWKRVIVKPILIGPLITHLRI